MNFKPFLYSFIITGLLIVGFNYDATARLVSGITSHNHSSSTGGGATLAPTALTIPSGTTLASPTVTGTLTNSGTISGGTVSPVTMSASGAVSGTTGTFTGALSGTTISGSNSFSSTKACASGYARATPNYCLKNSATFTFTALASDTCTTVASPSTDAKMIILRVQLTLGTSNIINTFNQADISVYSDNSCGATVVLDKMNNGLRETIALASTDTIKNAGILLAPLISGTNYFLKWSRIAGTPGNGEYRVIGYFD